MAKTGYLDGGYMATAFNLLRFTAPRTIKETFVPVTDYRYPFMREP